MADINISKEHNIDTDILRTRLEELAKDLQAKYGIRYKWDGDTILLDGSGIKKAFLQMTSSTVTIEITLRMMAKLLKGKIEEEINKKIGNALSS